MGRFEQMSAAERRRTAECWLAEINAALAARDYRRAAQAMSSDGYWRDLIAFDWEIHTSHGRDEIETWLAAHYAQNRASGFERESEPEVGRLGEFGETLEFFFRFTTAVAVGRGFVRLSVEPGEAAAVRGATLLTAMEDLKDFPERTRLTRPKGMHASGRSRENWLDRRIATREFRDRDPDVIVIGAGMAGLMVAARLGQLDVPTLIVDRLDRVGDVWRTRYHSLTLHNQICMNHFPYLPFPETWPVYIPKDKLANWFEFYADAMELNVWTRTVFLGGTYDADGRWTVRLQLADGSIRTMRPGHVIMAIGVSGIPNMPRFGGMDEFAGTVMHSSGPTDGLDVEGKSVLVVGTGTSGHDIAQDLYLRGAAVTMLQRSPTTVVNLEPSSVRPYEIYRANEGVRPIEDTDLMAAATPYDLIRRLHGPLSRQAAEDDRELLDGLRRIGFALDNGEDDTGYFLKLLRYQAGYYLNVGASELLIEGKIKLKSGLEIERLSEHEVIFSDGTALQTDILVLATGYQPLQEAARALFGDEVADRVGPIWGFGTEYELRNMYGRTPQDGFYVTGGGFMGCRSYSPYTARLIKASLEGLMPPRMAVVPRSAVNAEAAATV